MTSEINGGGPFLVNSAAVPVPVTAPAATTAPAVSALSKLDAVLAAQQAGVTAAPSSATAVAGANLAAIKLRQEAIQIVRDKGLDEQARKLAATVDYNNLMAISEFGVDVQQAVAKVDQLLVGNARNDRTGTVGQTVRNINKAIDSFDRKIVLRENGWLAQAGSWLSGTAKDATDLAVSAVTDFWARYQPVEKQVQDLSRELETVENAIKADEAKVAIAEEVSLDSIDQFTVRAAALIYSLENLETNVLPALKAKVDATPSDPKIAQEYARHKEAGTELDKRIHALFEQRTFADQQVKSAGMMRTSAVQGAGRLNTVRQNIVPLFYRLAFQEVVVFKQQQGIHMADEVVNGFERMMRESAHNLGDAYVASAKASVRPTISGETFEDVAQTLAAALTEANQIVAEGRQINAAEEEKMANAREILNRAMVGMGELVQKAPVTQ